MSNNAGPVPPVTLSVDGLPLNASAQITQIGTNAFQLSVSTDPLGDPSVADIAVTATGPNGSQRIDVSLQIDQIN